MTAGFLPWFPVWTFRTARDTLTLDVVGWHVVRLTLFKADKTEND